MTDAPTPADALRRRTVLAGAWAAPVVGAALASPGAAASTTEITGTIVFTPRQYRGTRVGDRVEFPPLTGTVTSSRGPMPSKAFVNFSDPNERVDLRRDAGRFTPVDPVTGRFSFDGVYNAIVDGENPFGFAYAGIAEEDADGAIFGYDVAELDG
jgi:hypothetical protein